MWLGVVAWLSCDCIIHELVDRGSWTGVGVGYSFFFGVVGCVFWVLGCWGV